MSLGDVTWRKCMRSRLPWPGAGCKGGAGPEEEADAVRRRTSEPTLSPPVAQRPATMRMGQPATTMGRAATRMRRPETMRMRMGRQKTDKDAVEEGEIGDRWIFFTKACAVV